MPSSAVPADALALAAEDVLIDDERRERVDDSTGERRLFVDPTLYDAGSAGTFPDR